MSDILDLGVDITDRVSTHDVVSNDASREFVLVPEEELTHQDWREVARALCEIADFDETNYNVEIAGRRRMLLEVAAAKNWVTPEKHVLIALDTANRPEISGSQGMDANLNLFCPLPVTCPTVIDSSRRQIASEKANVFLASVDKPALVFLETLLPSASGRDEKDDVFEDQTLTEADITMVPVKSRSEINNALSDNIDQQKRQTVPEIGQRRSSVVVTSPSVSTVSSPQTRVNQLNQTKVIETRRAHELTTEIDKLIAENAVMAERVKQLGFQKSQLIEARDKLIENEGQLQKNLQHRDLFLASQSPGNNLRSSNDSDGILNKRLRTTGPVVTPLLISPSAYEPESHASLPTQVSEMHIGSSRLENNSRRNSVNRSKVESRFKQDIQSKGTQSNEPRRFVGRPLKPKHFGLPTWDPSSDITNHIKRVAEIIPEARLMTTEANLQRILIQTLPPDFAFIQHLVGKHSQFESFATEVARYLSDRREEQMRKFFEAKIAPEEHVLGYFSRICDLYSTANLLFGDAWMNDSSHAMPVLLKFNQALEASSMLEMSRRVDEIDKLTIHELKQLIIRARPTAKTSEKEPLGVTSIPRLDAIGSLDDSEKPVNNDEVESESEYNPLIIDE